MDSISWTPNNCSKFDRASWISKLFFDWARRPILDNCRNPDESSKNIDDTPNEFKANNLHQKIQRLLDKKKKYDHLLKYFMRILIKDCLLTSLLSFSRYCVLLLIQAFFLGKLIASITAIGTDAEIVLDQYVASGVVIVISILIAILTPHFNINGESVGSKVRIMASTLIYQKLLKIRLAEMKRINIGLMINLYANDVGKFDACARFVFSRISDPLTLAITITFLQLNCGLPGTIGVLVQLLLGVSVLGLIKIYKKLGQKKTALVDQRLKITTEMILEAKTMKMFCWENEYMQSIQEIRKKEMKLALKIFYCKIPNLLCNTVSQHIAITIVLASMLFLDNNISPKVVYTCFAVYKALQLSVISLLGKMIESIADAYVSFQRIQKILLIDEINEEYISKGVGSVELIDVTSSWQPQITLGDTTKFYLNSINLTFSNHSINAIVGPVGSGKSMLLLTVANELFIHSGSVKIGGSMTYLPQEPWLFPSTIKQNILFGLPYDDQRYQDVIYSCALSEDLFHFPNGDQTVIDDKGLTLSGGQNARIALARAMYSKSSIYLLDDPLSAVDAKVAKHIWEKNCKKTIILVTHCLDLLSLDDHVIELKRGKTIAKSINQMEIEIIQKRYPTLERHEKVHQKTSTGNVYFRISESFRNGFLLWCRMGWKLCDGYAVAFLIAFFSLLPQVFRTSFDILSSKWIYSDTHTIVNALVRWKPWSFSLPHLGILIGMQITANLVKLLLLIHFSVYTAEKFNRNMLRSLSRVNMRFYDTHLTGQIMIRCSKDMQFVDDFLLGFVQDISNSGFLLLGLIVNASYSNISAIGPIMLVVFLILIIIKVSLKAVKPIKTMEGSARSPIYSYMNSTVNGVAVIRSHQNHDALIKEFNNRQNMYSSIWFLLRGMNYWMCTVCQLGGFLLTTFIVLLTLILPHLTDGSRLGLGISSTVVIGDVMQLLLQSFAEVDCMLLAVERLQGFIDLPPEKGYDHFLQPIPLKWPLLGHISFKNVSLFYGSSRVLSRVNFDIFPKQKIGIVGRTGAGKSSIVSALFRLAETEGVITIDGIDIKNLPLVYYRKKISIIPQNPVILSGSIRRNLDTLSQYTDEELWHVLECVQLKDVVVKMERKLEDGMGQFSCGQKQLFCLARTLLHKNKILILDEATSNVDNRTDGIIQKLIKTKFSKSTIIIIAHRIQTIYDLDRIMIVENGKILEFEKPSQLTRNNTALKQLLANTFSGR